MYVYTLTKNQFLRCKLCQKDCFNLYIKYFQNVRNLIIFLLFFLNIKVKKFFLKCYFNIWFFKYVCNQVLHQLILDKDCFKGNYLYPCILISLCVCIVIQLRLVVHILMVYFLNNTIFYFSYVHITIYYQLFYHIEWFPNSFTHTKLL